MTWGDVTQLHMSDGQTPPSSKTTASRSSAKEVPELVSTHMVNHSTSKGWTYSAISTWCPDEVQLGQIWTPGRKFHKEDPPTLNIPSSFQRRIGRPGHQRRLVSTFTSHKTSVIIRRAPWAGSQWSHGWIGNAHKLEGAPVKLSNS